MQHDMVVEREVFLVRYSMLVCTYSTRMLLIPIPCIQALPYCHTIRREQTQTSESLSSQQRGRGTKSSFKALIYSSFLQSQRLIYDEKDEINVPMALSVFRDGTDLWKNYPRLYSGPRFDRDTPLWPSRDPRTITRWSPVRFIEPPSGAVVWSLLT